MNDELEIRVLLESHSSNQMPNRDNDSHNISLIVTSSQRSPQNNNFLRQESKNDSLARARLRSSTEEQIDQPSPELNDNAGIDINVDELRQEFHESNREDLLLNLNTWANKQGFHLIYTEKERFRKKTEDYVNTMRCKSCYGDSRKTAIKRDEYVGDDSNRVPATSSKKCPFYLLFTFKDGVYTLSKSCNTHNHKLDYTAKSIITNTVKQTISRLKDKTKTVEALKEAVNTSHNMNLSYQDVYYAKKKLKERDFGKIKEDAKNLIRLIKAKNGFLKYTTDSEASLNRLLYIPKERKAYFQKFSDVLIIDSTLKTNKFNMVLVTFVGINSNGSNIPYGFGLISNETEESYTWLIGKFLEIVEKGPEIIFSDECPSIKAGTKAI